MTRRRLPQAKADSGLGLPTIMDRDLAASYGVPYIHLAVFAIDIDRVYWLDPELTSLPFGWEVYLTECFLLQQLTAASSELLEAICQPLLEETPGEPPLGGQIVFAVYDALQRGVLPVEMTTLFGHWRSPPRDLCESLAQLHATPDVLPRLCAHCLNAELSPPLAPPTRAALAALPAAPSGE
jgi:hypothetical protein